MGSRNLDLAIELVKSAIDADTRHNYSEAKRLYEEALDNFGLVLKYEQRPASRELITKKVEEYSGRLEIIKDYIDKSNASLEDAKENPNVRRALENVDRAEEFDRNKQYSEAYKYYCNALDFFVLALKFNKDPNIRPTISSLTHKYLTRAEELKAQLEEERKRLEGDLGPAPDKADEDLESLMDQMKAGGHSGNSS